MSGYKHIEIIVARFIAGRYRSVVEAGAGSNTHAAELIQRSGTCVTCIDLFIPSGFLIVPYIRFDVSTSDYSLFTGVDCIYAIRPVEEMMAPLIRFARTINADLIVYHLGFEGYPHRHRVIECGVPLIQYIIRQN